VTNFDEAQSRLTALSKWIDDHNADKTPLEQLLTRFLKIHEERGEAAAEIIGMSGQNPRKGVTANILDVQEESLDWAITALGVVEHITGNRGDAFRLLFKKIQDVDARRLGTLGPIASDVKIDKFLAATEGDSAVPVVVTTPEVAVGAPMESRVGHRHSDTDPWSVDGNGRPTAYIDGCLIQENATETVVPPQ